MDPLVSSSLIGFGASAFNYGANLLNSGMTFRQNKQLAALQNQYNIDQWNRQNAYNDPSAQMERYRKAGLNPNLIYGQQNLSAESPQLVGGTPRQPVTSSPIDAQTVAQLSLLRAQKENIEADTQQKVSQSSVNVADAGLKMAQGKLTEADIGRIASEVGLNNQQIQNLRSENERIKANTLQIKQLTAESVAKVDLLKSQKGLTDEQLATQIIENANKQSWYDAMIKKLKAEANCTEKQAEYYVQESLLTTANINIANLDYRLKWREDVNWNNTYNNNVVEQQARIRALASQVTKDNVENLNKLYGALAPAVSASTNTPTTTK